ncbi:MAG: response regulator [Candidatus Abyssobacteria bacterium SURF_5]|uniref:Response regulator n=1 Tax=Abyssobacteria bacterium (strain SURF_5) TaxID=2093360 RepID=A0A3A4P6M8_ABYX5|nr:MAG: response regulator [Candidatus Abyssubacteria bacterium SURF_5]
MPDALSHEGVGWRFDMPQKKVLVVEDQASFREFLQVTLAKLGLEVFTALTGKVALARAKDHKPDLILLDVMLPDMDGYEICKSLRSRGETSLTPVIFVSAVGSDKHIQKAMAAGATDYLIKPLSMDDVKALVDRYLGA